MSFVRHSERSEESREILQPISIGFRMTIFVGIFWKRRHVVCGAGFEFADTPEDIYQRSLPVSPHRPGVDWSGGMNAGGKAMSETIPVAAAISGKNPPFNSQSRDALLVDLGRELQDLKHQLTNSELRVSQLERELELANASGVVNLQQEVSELKSRLKDAEEICKKDRLALQKAQASLVTEQSRNLEISAKLGASEAARISAKATAQVKSFDAAQLRIVIEQQQAQCAKLCARVEKLQKQLLRRHGPSLTTRLGSWMKNSGSRVLGGVYLIALGLGLLLKLGFKLAKFTVLAPLYYALSFFMLPTAASRVLRGFVFDWNNVEGCVTPVGELGAASYKWAKGDKNEPSFLWYLSIGLPIYVLFSAQLPSVIYVYYLCASHLCSLYHNEQFMWVARMLASVRGWNLDSLVHSTFYILLSTNALSLLVELGRLRAWWNGDKSQPPVKEENLIDEADETEKELIGSPAAAITATLGASPIVSSTPASPLQRMVAACSPPTPTPARSSDLLEFVGTANIPATTQDFVARDHFVDGVNPKTGLKLYLGSNLKTWFLSGQGLVEKPHSVSSLRYDKLRREANDAAIRAELGSARDATTLEEVFYLISRQPKGEQGSLPADGWWNLFYVKDASGVLRAAFVYWCVDGWFVYALSVEHPREWRADCRVFSRNSC